MDAQIVSKLKDHRLVPFFLTLLLFNIVCQPFLGYPDESVLTAVFKILPILCLAWIVFQNFNDSTISDGLYTNCTLYGLLISCLGDICLVWRETLFYPGLFFFALTHAFYALALKTKYTKGNKKDLFCYLLLGSFLFIAEGIECCLVKGVVFFYSALLTTVAFLAVSWYEEERSAASTFAALGGMLFMASDFLLAVDRWRIGIFASEFFVMISYFSAQACFALSTLKK